MLQRTILFLGIANLIGLIVVIGFATVTNSKLVYVDSNKLINGYQGMIDARKVYQQKAGSWKANIDTLASEVQKQIIDYEKESLRMTAKEKDLTKQLIRSKQQQLSDYQRAINEKAGQEDAEATKKVVGEINTFIKDYGQQHNFSIIFAATEYGNIAFAKEGLDITEKVLQELNSKYTGKK